LGKTRLQLRGGVFLGQLLLPLQAGMNRPNFWYLDLWHHSIACACIDVEWAMHTLQSDERTLLNLLISLPAPIVWVQWQLGRPFMPLLCMECSSANSLPCCHADVAGSS
jgi:hypothetical protein